MTFQYTVWYRHMGSMIMLLSFFIVTRHDQGITKTPKGNNPTGDILFYPALALFEQSADRLY